MNDIYHIPVSCAIIERDGTVLAAQRSAAVSNAGKWEFPGGKVEAFENTVECLHRELLEELSIEIIIKDELPPITHHYPEKTIVLYPFVCSLKQGEIRMHEHQDIVWKHPCRLQDLNWSEADVKVLHYYIKKYLPAKNREV